MLCVTNYYFFLTVVVLGNDTVLSELEMAQQVRHQAVKWRWTVQNKQAGWCRSLMGTSVQTEEWSWEGVPWDAKEREPDRDWERGEERREGGMRWRGIQQGAHCQTFTTPSLLKQCKVRAGAKVCVKRNTHRGNNIHLHTCKTGRAHSRPAAFRIWWSKDFFFFPCFHFHGLLSARQVSVEWIFPGMVEARLSPTIKREHNVQGHFYAEEKLIFCLILS